MFAYCRTKSIKSFQYLGHQSRHARREDETSKPRIRKGAEPGAALAWSIDEGPQPDYAASFRELKKVRGASERKGAQLGLHMLVGVSPEWVREAGDLHDPENPRNRELLDAAREWADTWSNGGCYAARIDLDETGGAVVDLFIAPLAEQHHKSGKSKLTVSVNKALEALSLQHTGKKSKHFAALNTSWAEYASAHLDPRLQRGRPKDETGAEHVGPDRYRAMMQEAQAARDAARRATMEAQQAQNEARKAEEEAREAQARLDAEAARLAQTMDALTGLSEEIEAGTLKRDDKGNIKAKNSDRLMAGGKIVIRLARAFSTIMHEIKSLRRDLKAAIDSGIISPGREDEAKALAERPISGILAQVLAASEAASASKEASEETDGPGF